MQCGKHKRKPDVKRVFNSQLKYVYIKLLNWGKLDKIKYENIDFELGSTESLASRVF
jgi:hypothetical protein